MLFSWHSHRPTSTTRSSPASDLTHRQLETNQCTLTVHTWLINIPHFISNQLWRSWFDRPDCGDLISPPSNLYLFVWENSMSILLSVSNKGNTSRYWAIKLVNRTQKDTDGKCAHARAHTQPCSVYSTMDGIPVWHLEKSISAQSERCVLTPQHKDKEAENCFLLTPKSLPHSSPLKLCVCVCD